MRRRRNRENCPTFIQRWTNGNMSVWLVDHRPPCNGSRARLFSKELSSHQYDLSTSRSATAPSCPSHARIRRGFLLHRHDWWNSCPRLPIPTWYPLRRIPRMNKYTQTRMSLIRYLAIFFTLVSTVPKGHRGGQVNEFNARITDCSSWSTSR